jgi:hypothetical protein
MKKYITVAFDFILSDGVSVLNIVNFIRNSSESNCNLVHLTTNVYSSTKLLAISFPFNIFQCIPLSHTHTCVCVYIYILTYLHVLRSRKCIQIGKAYRNNRLLWIYRHSANVWHKISSWLKIKAVLNICEAFNRKCLSDTGRVLMFIHVFKSQYPLHSLMDLTTSLQ